MRSCAPFSSTYCVYIAYKLAVSHKSVDLHWTSELKCGSDVTSSKGPWFMKDDEMIYSLWKVVLDTGSIYSGNIYVSTVVGLFHQFMTTHVQEVPHCTLYQEYFLQIRVFCCCCPMIQISFLSMLPEPQMKSVNLRMKNSCTWSRPVIMIDEKNSKKGRRNTAEENRTPKHKYLIPYGVSHCMWNQLL